MLCSLLPEGKREHKACEGGVGSFRVQEARFPDPIPNKFDQLFRITRNCYLRYMRTQKASSERDLKGICKRLNVCVCGGGGLVECFCDVFVHALLSLSLTPGSRSQVSQLFSFLLKSPSVYSSVWFSVSCHLRCLLFVLARIFLFHVKFQLLNVWFSPTKPGLLYILPYTPSFWYDLTTLDARESLLSCHGHTMLVERFSAAPCQIQPICSWGG